MLVVTKAHRVVTSTIGSAGCLRVWRLSRRVLHLGGAITPWCSPQASISGSAAHGSNLSLVRARQTTHCISTQCRGAHTHLPSVRTAAATTMQAPYPEAKMLAIDQDTADMSPASAALVLAMRTGRPGIRALADTLTAAAASPDQHQVGSTLHGCVWQGHQWQQGGSGDGAGLSTLVEAVVSEVGVSGWCVVRDALSESDVTALRAECEARLSRQDDHDDDLRGCKSEDGFREAKVGRGHGAMRVREVRGDLVAWLGAADVAALPTLGRYWALLSSLMASMNRAFFTCLRRFEGHLAVYPPGEHYARHTDQHTGPRHRIISAIAYLNPPDWRHPEDGGELRLFLPPGTPLHGTSWGPDGCSVMDAATAGARDPQHATESTVHRTGGNGKVGWVFGLPVRVVEAGEEEEMGGKAGEMYVDVPPLGGTLVVFRSGGTEHAVRRAVRARYSLTGWMRDDEEPLL